jgi:hypothetical protein
MSRTDISNSLGRNIDAARLSAALESLEAHCLVTVTREQPCTSGRPATYYQAILDADTNTMDGAAWEHEGNELDELSNRAGGLTSLSSSNSYNATSNTNSGVRGSRNGRTSSPLDENSFERSCYACGGNEFWHHDDGERVCSRCHPNPIRELNEVRI